VAQGQYLQVNGNTCVLNADSNHQYGGGILANSSNSQVIGNTVVGNVNFNPSTNPAYGYGIDAGGSVNIVISSNNISSYGYGVDVGGCQNSFVSGNYIFNCMGQGVFVDVIEASENGLCFPNPTSNITISENVINIPIVSGSTFYGILINNGAQGIAINNNKFLLTSGDGSNCLRARTNDYTVKGNLFNGDSIIGSHYGPSVINGYQTFRYLDIADTIQLSSSATAIQSILSMNASTYSSYLNFIIVTSGGSGYTSAPTVNIAGSGGASAQAFIFGGVVLGIRMTNFGSGYISSSPPAVSFTGGGGTGAAATAYIGLLPPSKRELRIICNNAILFAETGTNPPQNNYTEATITAPAGTSISWFFTFGSWNALSFMN